MCRGGDGPVDKTNARGFESTVTHQCVPEQKTVKDSMFSQKCSFLQGTGVKKNTVVCEIVSQHERSDLFLPRE